MNGLLDNPACAQIDKSGAPVELNRVFHRSDQKVNPSYDGHREW
jgi:hypothetical protein